MSRRVHDRFAVRLYAGPYKSPRVKLREHVTCHYRRPARIVGWTDARIVWPRCHPLGGRRGRGGLYVDDKFLRALTTEAAPALAYWFGLSESSVRWMRRRLRISGRTPGWQVLHERIVRLGNEAWRAQGISDEDQKARRERALKGHFIQFPRAKQRPERTWTAEELALLGTISDKKIADRKGTNEYIVRHKRSRLGIPTFRSTRKL